MNLDKYIRTGKALISRNPSSLLRDFIVESDTLIDSYDKYTSELELDNMQLQINLQYWNALDSFLSIVAGFEDTSVFKLKQQNIKPFNLDFMLMILRAKPKNKISEDSLMYLESAYELYNPKTIKELKKAHEELRTRTTIQHNTKASKSGKKL